ncbi:MAG: hypothetical protein HKN76_21165 [Saprospiraceae bacterium]|nr:hypothetical protein [Saprospiraceae bacterium]
MLQLTSAKQIFLLLLVTVPSIYSCKKDLPSNTSLNFNSQSAILNYGVSKFQQAVKTWKHSPEIQSRNPCVLNILSGEDPSPGNNTEYLRDEMKALPTDGYKIINKRDTILILGKNDRGCLYALQDIRDQLSDMTYISDIRESNMEPALSFRAIKFNLPWSPYRPGKAAELHEKTCRDLVFWEAFLDMMVENRFNALTLWNKHPFPFLIKSTNFPLANDFSDQEMQEWRSFWTSLFKMAKDRGIETYLVNWNIVVSQEFAESYGAQIHDDRSELVKKYTRESVTQTINEYEDLTGLGVTLADWMGNWGDSLMTSAEREKWIEETFVAGMQDANRKIKFIHRAVLAGDPQEMRGVIDRANLPDKTIVEVKFNWSHGHSTPNLSLTHANNDGTIMRGFWDPKPENYFIAWMIRNEDFFVLRWGDPAFIKEHIKTNNLDYVHGYFIGSEGYIPAWDYSHVENHPHKTWNYAFEKQWLFYQLWGRLMYHPEEPNELFAKSLEKKYPGVNGNQMLDAFSLASRVPLYIASFYKSTWDFTLYSEGFLAPRSIGFDDEKSPFISLEELMKHDVLDQKYLSIEQYCEQVSKGTYNDSTLITPLQLADKIQTECHQAMQSLPALRSSSGDPVLHSELDDIETWCHLGFYFADKLRAGVALQTYIFGRQLHEKEDGIILLNKCLQHWENIVRLTKDRYKPMPYVSIDAEHPQWENFKEFHWKNFITDVKQDIAYAQAIN